MRRIILVTHAGGSPFHGPNMRWYYLGQALRKMGVQVEIVSSSNFHKYTSPPKIVRSLETSDVNGLTYHWLKTSLYNGRGLGQVRNQLEFLIRCFQFSNYLSQRNPDVVVASSPHPLVVFPARAIAKKSGSRFIFEVRDLWPEVLLELGGFRRWHPYIFALSWAERYGVGKAERVISVKPGDGEYFKKKYGLPESRFSYIPNGFLPEEASAALPEEVEVLFDRYRFVIGYVGAISTYYGLDRLVELARFFRDVEGVGFFVVGKGDHADRLQTRAAELGLDFFHFVGAMPKAVIPSALARFNACYVGLEDIGVHRYGVSCNKIYEYMHAGKPIIGSYRAGYDPVKAAGCGFVTPPGEYDELVQGIYRLMDEPGLAEELGARAKSYFDNHHDFRVVAKNLKEIFFPELTDKTEECRT